MELAEKYGQFFQDRHHKMQEALQGRLNYIPVYGQIHEYACALSGTEPRTFYTDPVTLIRGTLDTSLKYGLDTPNMSYDVYDIEAEALGMKVYFPATGSPAVDYNRPLIKEPDDIRLLETPDPRYCARMPFVREVNRLYKEMTGLTPGIKFTGPFSLACIVRGYSQLITDILITPDFAHELLSFLTDKVLIPLIQFLAEDLEKDSNPLISGADAWASIPNINLEIQKEFNLPYIEKIRSECGEKVVVRNWVGESKLHEPEKLLELKLKASPQLLLAQDPDVEFLGPELFSEFAQKHDVPLVLGVGAGFLRTANAEEVKAKTRRYIHAAKQCRGFGLYLCNVESSTPPENIAAVVDLARSSME